VAAATEMGPVISIQARERVADYLGRAEAEGGRVALDGRSCGVPGHPDGYYIGPSIVDHVGRDSELYRDEVFGPLLAVVRVHDLDEAIELVNAHAYGNGTSVFTSAGEAARRFQRGVHVGMVGVNIPVPVPMAFHSFGGWKQSLFGEHHIHGPEGIQFYTRSKVVTTRWPGRRERSQADLSFPTAR
jgi:malonate-semialdehyde dehydrogenase (acetylating)/methylmalonate-semialdehyde dehydrogenase